MVFGRLISAIGMLSIISILVGILAMANVSISHNLKSASFAVTLNTNSFSGRDKPANSKVLNVVTSVAPIANIVKNIAGDKIGLNQLIPDGIDSHTFELTPSGAVRGATDADLVIINGLHLESGVEKVSNASRAHNPNQQLLKLADNTINRDQRIYDFSFEREGRP